MMLKTIIFVLRHYEAVYKAGYVLGSFVQKRR
jgi:hypothetical protein